ncbi:unnamed protein product [Clonostachys rhizophaga]|uniref:Uncharacterized protein n=1 Tax=Clonostachys rhizophaga TaxID=160324 RepID=A0A9N9ZAY2_9HYPO|nr:unnamed protein product [Clonostachys rhizophaga]
MGSSSGGPEFYLGPYFHPNPDRYETLWRHSRTIPWCVMPWCVYCGYEFKISDRILHNDGELQYFYSVINTYVLVCLLTTGCEERSITWVVTRLSLTLSNKPEWEVKCQPQLPAIRNKRRFCACGLSGIPRCEYKYPGAPVCHRACHDILSPAMFGNAYPTVVDYWKVRRPGFKPTTSDSRRRHAFIEEDLVSVLAGCIRKLPAELLYQIAGYGSSAYATTQLRTLMAKQEPRDTVFDLRKDIWAEYVDFEGQTYIRALSNTTLDILDGVFKGTWKLMFSNKQYRSSQTMLIEMSALGIRRIIFTDDSSRPDIEQKPDIWWQAMRFRDGPFVVAETDGVKLRCLTFESERFNRVSAHSSPNVMWPTPAKYDHYQLLSVTSQKTPTPRSHLPRHPRRMDSVDLQSPDILGLSFAVYLNGEGRARGRFIINIHAHLPGESHIFYREIDRKAPGQIICLYIPLEPQEVITEIWAFNEAAMDSVTHANNGLPPPLPELRSSEPSYTNWQLVFKTSKGRFHQIGSARHAQSTRWKLVHSSSQGLKRMFFEHIDDTQLYALSLGFGRSDSGHVAARANETQSQAHPTLDWPHPPHHHHHRHHHHCSSAVLDGVIEVTKCLRILNNGNPSSSEKYTSGLLLRYQDGHVESLGEARLEFTKSCKVLPTDVIRFIFQHYWVKFCTVGPARGNDGPDAEYVEIPMSGTLHWCFHKQEALLRHNEQRISPKIHPMLQ